MFWLPIEGRTKIDIIEGVKAIEAMAINWHPLRIRSRVKDLTFSSVIGSEQERLVPKIGNGFSIHTVDKQATLACLLVCLVLTKEGVLKEIADLHRSLGAPNLS